MLNSVTFLIPLLIAKGLGCTICFLGSIDVIKIYFGLLLELVLVGASRSGYLIYFSLLEDLLSNLPRDGIYNWTINPEAIAVPKDFGL